MVDFSKEKPLTALGNNADDFNYLAFEGKKIKQHATYLKGIQSSNIDSVLLHRKKMAVKKIGVLDYYYRTHKMSERYYAWIKAKYTYEPYERIWVENIANKDSVDDITLQKILERGLNNDTAAMINREYNDLADAYIRKKISETKAELTVEAYFNFAAGDLLKGKTKDVSLSRITAWRVKADDNIYNAIFKRYDELVKDECIKSFIIKEREDFIADSKKTHEPIATFTSLNEIFKRYKHKAIYIDFWASWCVPCRAEIPDASELKKKLRNEDVVFVYLAYRDSEKAWIKARKDLDIEGEHYLLNERLMTEAEEAFNISGIPHYVIIDKQGNIASKRADRPGTVYNQLLTLATKN